MKECDILGVKTYSYPSYIFSRGSGPPQPHMTYVRGGGRGVRCNWRPEMDWKLPTCIHS